MPSLADTASPALPERAVLLIPLGSTEQHGPHLPCCVDTEVAAATAEGLAAGLHSDGIESVLAPPLPFGASGEHQGFPGTLSLGTEVLRSALIELARSAEWAGRILFVNGHGGNAEALVGAVRQLRHEGHDAAWLACAVRGADAHAGRSETSLMLHLQPWAVGKERPRGATDPLPVLLPALRAGGVAAVSPNGVLGDAHGACPQEGEELLRRLLRSGRAALLRWRPDGQGRLQ